MTNIVDLNPHLRARQEADEGVEKQRQALLDKIDEQCVNLKKIFEDMAKDEEDLRNILYWLHHRMSGQDLTQPIASPFIQHEEQRGCVPLHPTGFFTNRAEAEFIDPKGTGRYRLTLEKVDD